MSKFEMLGGQKINEESGWGYVWEIKLKPETCDLFLSRSCWLGILTRKGEKLWRKDPGRPKDEDVYIMQVDGQLVATFQDRDPEVGDLIDIEDIDALLMIERMPYKTLITLSVNSGVTG